MRIFIDTAVKGCNIVLFDDDRILATAQEPIERGHAETLLPLYQNLVQDLNKSSQDIETVYVTVGPGSFTGLRVGLTVARFMGFSLGVPVHGITSFQAFSAALDDGRPRLVLVETKRADYYCQLLDVKHEPLSEPQSLMVGDIIALMAEQGDNPIIIGDAVARFQSEARRTDWDYINMPIIDAPKAAKALQMEQMSLTDAEGYYIRDADVSQPKT